MTAEIIPQLTHITRNATGSSSGWREITPDGSLDWQNAKKSTGYGEYVGKSKMWFFFLFLFSLKDTDYLKQGL